MTISFAVVPDRNSGRLRAPAPTPVGASFRFDPRADGIAGIYASRVLERGLDPRALCAEIRADRLGATDRGPHRRVARRHHRITRFGRGTAQGLQAGSAAQNAAISPPSRSRRVASSSRSRPDRTGPRPRQLAIAGLLALLLLPLGVILAAAQDAPPKSPYIAQPVDTLEGVTAEVGVDPAAILAASALQNPPELTIQETFVIPDPGESPDAAAANAALHLGGSLFVAGAHERAPGETLAAIAPV